MSLCNYAHMFTIFISDCKDIQRQLDSNVLKNTNLDVAISPHDKLHPSLWCWLAFCTDFSTFQPTTSVLHKCVESVLVALHNTIHVIHSLQYQHFRVDMIKSQCNEQSFNTLVGFFFLF